MRSVTRSHVRTHQGITPPQPKWAHRAGRPRALIPPRQHGRGADAGLAHKQHAARPAVGVGVVPGESQEGAHGVRSGQIAAAAGVGLGGALAARGAVGGGQHWLDHVLLLLLLLLLLQWIRFEQLAGR